MSECRKSLTLNSIGVCVANPENTKLKPCVIVAYSTGHTAEDIRLFSMKLPQKELYTRESFLNAIAKLEKAKSVSYPDYDNTDKDIYVCRPSVGETFEIVPRDDQNSRFVNGFAEIESDTIKFEPELQPFKPGKKLECTFRYRSDPTYTKNSYEYAAVNAYNACLLGRLLSADEFHLETGDGTRTKYEVRKVTSKYVDLTTLYIRSFKNTEDGVVEYYVTEPLLEINGDDMSHKTYQIIYKNVLKDYSINRFD